MNTEKSTEKNALQKSDVIPKEVAIKELSDFVEKWTYEKKEEHELEDEFPQVLKAIQKGLIVFDDKKKPVYTLVFPIKTDEGNTAVSEIDFRTRIKPSDLSNITKGVNVAKQQVEYTLRCLAYVSRQGKSMLDKFDKFDYKVIEQTATVFF